MSEKITEKTSDKIFEKALISKALGLSPTGGGPVAFSAITTDSRSITPGCLFVAIPGDRFDGHQFILEAIQKGASGILCQKGHAVTSQIPASPLVAVWETPDTTVAYRAIAKAWRDRHRLPVIAVAGSVGKTTTKELLSAILLGKWPRILKTRASENGFLGIPMTLLELREDQDAAVIEIGIDEPGAMIQHLELVEPQFSILTAIAPEHLEKLIDLETVAKEEMLALTETAQKGGFVAVNQDDTQIQSRFSEWVKNRARLQSWVSYGMTHPNAALQGKIEGDSLTVNGCGWNSESFPLILPGEHNARNLLGALAVAMGLGLTADEIRKGLKTFQPLFGRSNLIQLSQGTTLLCDYYNANPASVEASLGILTQKTKNHSGRRWVCLGDMLELGPRELEFHRDLAPILARHLNRNSDRIFLFGERMKALAEVLQAGNLNFLGTTEHFKTRPLLAASLAQQIQPNDFILLKGSRSMKMEEVHQELEKLLSSRS